MKYLHYEYDMTLTPHYSSRKVINRSAQQHHKGYNKAEAKFRNLRSHEAEGKNLRNSEAGKPKKIRNC